MTLLFYLCHIMIMKMQKMKKKRKCKIVKINPQNYPRLLYK